MVLFCSYSISKKSLLEVNWINCRLIKFARKYQLLLILAWNQLLILKTKNTWIKNLRQADCSFQYGLNMTQLHQQSTKSVANRRPFAQFELHDK